MSRWRHINGVLTEIDAEGPPEARIHVMSDIQPYQSMVTGEMVTSRSRHRQHLKEHGCIEVGNEKMEAPKITPPSREDRRRVLHQQLGDMSDRQANGILKDLRREYGR